MAVKRRKSRRKARTASGPKIVFANPPKRRRRRTVKRNPAPKRRRRRSSTVSAMFSHAKRAVRRRVHGNPKGSVSVGSNMTDAGISVLSGGLGFFGGLAANKIFPAGWVRFRGAILALAGILAVWKVKEKHIRIGFIGLAIEGATDLLKQNVTAFSTLSADDAAEHLLGAGSSEQLGYSPSSGLGEDEMYGEDAEMLGADAGSGIGEETEAVYSGTMFGESEPSRNW